MAEVVLHSTQHLSTQDLGAMAVFLQALPQAPAAPASPVSPPTAEVAQRGARVYEQHCAQCHGEQGRGIRGAYPPLAGNRAVTLEATANLVQVVLAGGYPPATRGNPRPFGMPPYVTVLSDADVAAVLTHIRTAWGNQAAPVSELEVAQQRGSSRP
jgi:mono/diheme cytochrome c family protein